MDEAFGGKNLKLLRVLRGGRSGSDEQAGFHALFHEAMVGIRNPGVHKLGRERDSQETIAQYFQRI